MSTYDPFSLEERPRLGTFVGLPSAPPGTVLVVDREGHPLQQLREHNDRLTPGEARRGRIRALYRVDVTEHHLEFKEIFPCIDDVGGFAATVTYTCCVTDPADVVRRGIHDVARTVVPAISETIRRECVRHPAEQFEAAERAAAQAVRGTELEGGHDPSFTISNFHLVLTLDGTASTFVHERKEVEREHRRQQDTARLEREKTQLQAELDRAKDALEAERNRASSEFEQERLLLQRTRERLESQLADQRRELELARDAARRLTEHQTDNSLELARLEFEAVRQQKQAELDAAKLALDLERAELQARYDRQALEPRLALQKVEVTQLTDMLSKGEYVALAMKLAQEPAAIGGVIKHMADQRREDTDRQLNALKLLVESDGLEGFEITEQAKAVLVNLIDNWTPHMDPTLEETETATTITAPSAEGMSTRARPSEDQELPWFTAEVEDCDPTLGLLAGDTYTIAFAIQRSRRPAAQAQSQLPVHADTLVARDEQFVELTVQVNSGDFELSENTRKLRLGRNGQSRNKARFELTPRHSGRCTLQATLHKDGNFIQQLHPTLVVGTPETDLYIQSNGRAIDGVTHLARRAFGMIISSSNYSYHCTAIGSSAASAHLSISPPSLRMAVSKVRSALDEVVRLKYKGRPVFQTDIDIPVEVEQKALQILARAGARLYQQLFEGPADGEDARQIGRCLRDVRRSARDSRVTVQVVSSGIPIPWSLLYLGDVGPEATLRWDNFLGIACEIEQIPYVGTPAYESCMMNSVPTLSVSLNVNTAADSLPGVIVRQRDWWTSSARDSNGRLQVTHRTSGQEFMSALSDGTPEQIIYFFGHALTMGNDVAAEPDSAALVFTDRKLTVGDLHLDAPASTPLPGRPLLVLNACDSAGLSPQFYDGLLTYFLQKGARGVIGAEAKLPARFASAWASAFFDLLLGGIAVGEAIQTLRNTFLRQNGNPLGLLYAAYCDHDIRISPPIARDGQA